MSLRKRLTGVIILVAAASVTFGIAKAGMQISAKIEDPIFSTGKESVYLWYTDESLTTYISAAAVAYNEQHDVRIVPVLESGLEYLENINQSSMEINAPDLYIISHDSLEKAYLAGLASQIQPTKRVILEEAYIAEGLRAATYQDKVIGYPFYFETSSLLYNKTYLMDFAKAQLEAEADLKAAEESQEQLETQGPTEEVEVSELVTETEPDIQKIEEKAMEILPTTIEEIKTFADSYDAPEQMESIFKWDVTDIFYNYFIIGDVINMGGEAGFDTSQIDIYNVEAIESLKVYQGLNQFFSIDTSEIDYNGILEEFIAGKVFFTVATTDAVSKIEKAKEEGVFLYDYGITETPNINDEMKTRSLSVTSCVVVNGYTQNKEAANDFAYFLTAEYNPILYARTGKVSAASEVDYDNAALEVFATEYEKSISMPKMIETGNFWVQLEIAFAEIWDGANVNQKLKMLSEQIMEQITGAPFTEELIIEPEEEKQELEYIDEELYKQEVRDEEVNEE